MKVNLHCLLLLFLTLHSQAQPLYFEHLTTSQGLSQNSVNCLLQDRRGFLWVGTENGLNRFDARTDGFQRFLHEPNDPKTLGSNRVTTIFEDRQNRLWVGCWGGGLNRYDPENERFIHFATKDGLPNNSVQGIVEDGSGRLWLTTERGLSRFDPRGFGAGSATGVFSNYFS
jgi:ligand-binding sensor domain-containing protein